MNRILFVNLEGKIGGAESSLLLMVKYLKNKFDINVAAPKPSPLTAALGSLKVKSFDLLTPLNIPHRSFKSLQYWLNTTRELTKIIRTVQPDIIHANSFYAGLPSAIAVTITRKKLLLHARDIVNIRVVAGLYNSLCTKIIAISESVRNALIEAGIKSKKIIVVYNGADTSNLTQSTETKASRQYLKGINENSFVFANVGQFVPWKNHINFLKTASQVAETLPNSRFLLVGDDIFGRDSAYKESVVRYAENLPIADKIDFTGWQKDMEKVWPKIDCLVHTAEREPFGRVIIEAMANKIPVIAIDSNGPGELIDNGKTGILVGADNEQGLKDAMLKIACDTDYANMLAHQGFEHVISNFSAQKTAYQIEQIYSEILAV